MVLIDWNGNNIQYSCVFCINFNFFSHYYSLFFYIFQFSSAYNIILFETAGKFVSLLYIFFSKNFYVLTYLFFRSIFTFVSFFFFHHLPPPPAVGPGCLPSLRSIKNAMPYVYAHAEEKKQYKCVENYCLCKNIFFI